MRATDERDHRKKTAQHHDRRCNSRERYADQRLRLEFLRLLRVSYGGLVLGHLPKRAWWS